jgi:hypothetical protein
MENESIPFSQYLIDLGITNSVTHSEFAHFAYMYANNCFNIAEQSKMKEGEPLQGYYHWRTVEPARFFKVHFTYWHSYDLIFGVDKMEELTFDEYITSANTQKENQIGIFNTESPLVNNILNKDKN